MVVFVFEGCAFAPGRVGFWVRRVEGLGYTLYHAVDRNRRRRALCREAKLQGPEGPELELTVMKQDMKVHIRIFHLKLKMVISRNDGPVLGALNIWGRLIIATAEPITLDMTAGT